MAMGLIPRHRAPFRLFALRCIGAFAAAFCVAGAVAVDAQQRADFTLARGRIGRLKLAMTRDEVVALFGPSRVKDVDLRLEGMPAPALEIRVDSVSALHPSFTAEISQSDGRINRVRVFDRRFKTAEGLGVRSTFGEIRAHHRVSLDFGEGHLYGIVEELQMSFDFGFRFSRQLPASARVQSVLVVLRPASK
jgi:hypothetical protein